ncbi:glycosyltransferase family 4 protein [Acetoanaerobium noterae]|uniref:glycosyltransferase family 4 protein n=1 Tax=Acetoanaerobium noterae TaxID=745369 RepID=UPI0033189821
MKLLVVCQYYYPEPFRITDICETLVNRGHEITILTGLPNYPNGIVPNDYKKRKKRYEIINGVKIIRCFEYGRGKSKIGLFANYFSFSISGTIKALFLKEKFDAVFVNQLSPIMMSLPAIAYKYKFNIKILLYCLDLWPASLAAGGIKNGSFVHNIFLLISRWIYNSVDSILITSSMFNDYFINILNINSVKITHLPQYAEDIFIPKNQIHNKKNNDTYNFVFAGNIGEMQSVDTIIYAANELRNNENVIIHLVGDGSKLNDCKLLISELNLSNVRLHGRKAVEDMPKFYDMADAMLITLKNNEILSMTLPGKVQSYMAAGKPIIGAINGETKTIINEANCGMVCDAEDYISLSKLILEFINSSNKLQMGLNAVEYYKSNYNKEMFIEKLENALLGLEE